MKYLISLLPWAFSFLKFRRKPYGAFDVTRVKPQDAKMLIEKGFLPVHGDVRQIIVLFEQ